MSASRVVVDIRQCHVAVAASVREIIQSDQRAVAEAAMEWPIRFETAAKAEYDGKLRRISGNLFRSIEGFSRRNGGDLVVGLRNKMHYAGYIEFGTKKHDIRPRMNSKGFVKQFGVSGYGGGAMAEALFWPGAGHPVAVVHHPGTKPYKFLSGPMQRKARQVIKALMKKIGFKP